MADAQIANQVAGVVVSTPNIWDAAMASILAVMGYFFAKRNDKIDETEKSLVAFKEEVPKIYATKDTMKMLFQEVTANNKEAIQRVEKQVDETKIAVKEQTIKIDAVKDTINQNQAIILQELSKKT